MRKVTAGAAQRAFSRLEMLVSVALILVMGGILLERMLYYQEQAEKAAMETTARELDSMLRIRAAELMLANRSGELAQLERTDPFTLFEVPPGRYSGETEGRAASSESGVWRYDRRAAEVFYLPSSRQHLRLINGDDTAIRYRVKLLRAAPEAPVAGVRLECLSEYRWFE
jgi:type II secretory pathway pseudopilin PulG